MAASPTVLFQRLRLRILHNAAFLLLGQSWLRAFTIFLCSALIWGLLFVVSRHLFFELRVKWDFPLHSAVMESIFGVMFMTLTVLLMFSTGIIIYSSLFASRESVFLLTTPIADDHVFAYKFQGAVAFSSWGFVLLASPILISYGLEVGAPWYFYVTLPLFFLGFTLIPGSIGAVLCLVLVNILPRHRWQAWTLLGVLLVGSAIGFAVYVHSQAEGLGPRASKVWFEGLLNELNLVRARLVPFAWVASGLMAAALAEPSQASYWLALVWSNGLFIYLLTLLLARRLYRRGFNRLASGGSLRRRYGGAWLDGLIRTLLVPLDPQTRLLIVKDFRTFRRDPAQWAQIMIFLGLASFYFISMRRYYEQDVGGFRNGISLLTFSATAFLMCAYTGRFIFPMLSLEGSKFWILGLLPLDRARLLLGKFAFSAVGCLVAGEFLVLVSNIMLSMPWLIVVMHAITIFVLALAVSGLSVGMGACLPNFRETDPSKIAVGYGGTLNLVAGVLVLSVVLILMAAPIHFVLARLDGPLTLADVPPLLWLAYGLGAVVGVAGTILPLRVGVRQLRRMEF